MDTGSNRALRPAATDLPEGTDHERIVRHMPVRKHQVKCLANRRRHFGMVLKNPACIRFGGVDTKLLKPTQRLAVMQGSFTPLHERHHLIHAIPQRQRDGRRQFVVVVVETQQDESEADQHQQDESVVREEVDEGDHGSPGKVVVDAEQDLLKLKELASLYQLKIVLSIPAMPSLFADDALFVARELVDISTLTTSLPTALAQSTNSPITGCVKTANR